jgi:hypothetical protein
MYNYKEYHKYINSDIGFDVTKFKYKNKYVYLMSSYSHDSKDVIIDKSMAEKLIKLFDLKSVPHGYNAVEGREVEVHEREVRYSYDTYLKLLEKEK